MGCRLWFLIKGLGLSWVAGCGFLLWILLLYLLWVVDLLLGVDL